MGPSEAVECRLRRAQCLMDLQPLMDPSLPMEGALGCADPDKSLTSFDFRIFTRAFDYADFEYAIYFAVRPGREDRAHFISMHGKMH